MKSSKEPQLKPRNRDPPQDSRGPHKNYTCKPTRSIHTPQKPKFHTIKSSIPKQTGWATQHLEETTTTDPLVKHKIHHHESQNRQSLLPQINNSTQTSTNQNPSKSTINKSSKSPKKVVLIPALIWTKPKTLHPNPTPETLNFQTLTQKRNLKPKNPKTKSISKKTAEIEGLLTTPYKTTLRETPHLHRNLKALFGSSKLCNPLSVKNQRERENKSSSRRRKKEK